MRVSISKLLPLVVLTMMSVSLHAQDRWLVDVDRAIATAEREEKDLFLLFTGSDWCPPCMKLEEEVLGAAGFYEEASQHFVFVKLDFPREKKLPQDLQKQNEAWSEKFGVGGYPTVVLVDHQQLPYAITGYEAGGVENYLGKLAEFRQAKVQRDENLLAASKAAGAERAKLLDRAFGWDGSTDCRSLLRRDHR